MRDFLALLLCLHLTWIIVGSSMARLIVHKGPRHSQATEGSTVVLDCKTDADKDIKYIWFKDSVIVAAYNMPKTDKYQVVGPAQQGIYDLKISNLQVSDQGSYGCQVMESGSGSGSWPTQSRKANLTVLKNVQSITLNQISPTPDKNYPGQVTVRVGEPAKIRCVSSGSNPEATITWIFRDTEKARVPAHSRPAQIMKIITPFQGSLVIDKVTKDSNGLIRTQSSLKIPKHTLLDAHHNLLISCEASIPRYETETKEARTRLYVMVAPQVQVHVHPRRPHNEYHENDIVTFTCQVIGRPSNFSYIWSIDGIGSLNDERRSTVKMTLTRKHHNAIVRCKVTNFETGENFAQIRVRYGPKFLPNLPVLYAASLGSNANLSCEVDANPEATFSWKRFNDGNVLERLPILRRHRIADDDFGNYECTVRNGAEFTPISRKVILARNSAPAIVSSPQQYARIGGAFRLECRINSVPLPRAHGITWLKGNKRIMDDDRVRSYREDFIGGTTSYLHFSEIHSTDFGVYNCSINNGFGRDSLLVHLTIEDNIPVAFIAGASIALLMVIIFMVVLLCVCRRGYWETRSAVLKESRKRRQLTCINSGNSLMNGYALNGTTESPSKQPLQSAHQYGMDFESTYCGQTELQPCDSDTNSLCNLGSMSHFAGSSDGPFLPNSSCVIHGSLLRSGVSKSSPIAYPQGIDLSDLSPYQQNTLSQMLSPRHAHQQQQHTSFVQQIPEEGEENGQEDSVRSCDSGYGGPGGVHQSEMDMKTHHVTFHPTPCVIHPYGPQITTNSLPPLQRTACPLHHNQSGSLKPCLSPANGGMPLHRLDEDYLDYHQHSTNV